MEILNLYSGLGGNRLKWDAEHKVTAVEFDAEIAKAYAERFPNDTVIVGDAHDYLLHNYMKFDFIWSSPPCPTHGQYRYNVGVIGKGFAAVFPDMKLYEEIIFLKHYFKGNWIVENVKPYYEPLVKPTAILARHLFWSNFPIAAAEFATKHIRSKNKIEDYDNLGFDISKTKISNKRQALRNCVDSDLGLHVFNCGEAKNLIKKESEVLTLL